MRCAADRGPHAARARLAPPVRTWRRWRCRSRSQVKPMPPCTCNAPSRSPALAARRRRTRMRAAIGPASAAQRPVQHAAQAFQLRASAAPAGAASPGWQSAPCRTVGDWWRAPRPLRGRAPPSRVSPRRAAPPHRPSHRPRLPPGSTCAGGTVTPVRRSIPSGTARSNPSASSAVTPLALSLPARRGRREPRSTQPASRAAGAAPATPSRITPSAVSRAAPGRPRRWCRLFPRQPAPPQVAWGQFARAAASPPAAASSAPDRGGDHRAREGSGSVKTAGRLKAITPSSPSSARRCGLLGRPFRRRNRRGGAPGD